ncbi:DNA methyltransferase [uncultured Secundilactobacillus sp.]|uniref:DNA methyltransferase n=1 Tax=uncultured Secundilactobacillus sp. TaxID=2813935 RepID=UPI00258622EE|nr:DNA methyltransferase [uncultured Secundilactobacillus sp.]
MANIEPQIFDELKKALVSFGNRYFMGEELNRAQLSKDLRAYDEKLLSRLFEIDFIKKHYIQEVAGQKFFQIEQLEDAVLYNGYWDTSYTKYENRVGLTSNGRYIEDSQDVVIDFPFKDGILTASMTKEDRDNGYDDAFLNEVIEKDEIDQLLDKKILKNVLKYDKSGENKATKFNKSADNLVIKGNNLLALHTLAEKYAQSIKLIYLDPPYNTGSDSFSYNDKFNQSTWLTFMKNRLEVAKELLSDDGVIAVQLDDSEGPYLKVLMDSIFGRNNELFTQYVLVRYAKKTLKADMDYHKQIEQIHFYKKNAQVKIIPHKKEEPYDYSKFTFSITTTGDPIETIILGGKHVDVFKSEQVKFESKEGNPEGLKEIWASGTILNGNSSGRFFRDYLDGRYKTDGYSVVYKVYDIGNDGNGFRYFTGPTKKGATKGKYYQGVPIDVKNGKITSKKKPVPGFIDMTESSGFVDMAGSFGNDRHEGGVELRNGKKPEKLLSEIIGTFSDEGDIVMDFFAGSGSTAATALKMNRRFIAVEQIDDQMKKIIKRLNNVIQGDKTGISKDISWLGGGSFVYTELFRKNMSYLQDIIEAKTFEELQQIFNQMLMGVKDSQLPADISFRADLDKIEWDTLRISFEDQKRLMIKLLDKNGLYFNYSEITDADVRDFLSEGEYQFNKSFYEDGE